MTDSRWQRFRHFIGFPASGHHAGEQLVATLGGAIGILLIVVVTQAVVGREGALVIVPSMGASAVLIFAAPHSPFAQPWAVAGGQSYDQRRIRAGKVYRLPQTRRLKLTSHRPGP